MKAITTALWVSLVSLCLTISVGCTLSGVEDRADESIKGRNKRSDWLRETLADTHRPHVFVVAHRGAWTHFPENSLPALEEAARLGVDIVEIDVRRSRDGRLLLMHDDLVDRTTTGSGSVTSMSFDEIRNLWLKMAEGDITSFRVPSLEESLITLDGKTLVQVDFKCTDCTADVLRIADRLKVLDQLIMSSNRFDQLSTTVSTSLSVTPLLLSDAPKIADDSRSCEQQKQLDPRAFGYATKFRSDDDPIVLCMPSIARKGRVWVQTFESGRAGPRSDVAAITDPDYVWGWLVDRKASIFLTDTPARLIAYLEARGRRLTSPHFSLDQYKGHISDD